MNKILVTGATGLVGSRFVELHKNKEELLCPTEKELDITKEKDVKKYISKQKPKSLIHFAAYTDVGSAEAQRGDKSGTCWKINVDGTENLLKAAKAKGTHFVFVSTDMVFSGSQSDPGPYAESHKPEADPNKLTWYGHTKSQAEKLVHKYFGAKTTILRLIYPVRSHFNGKSDYLRRPLKLYNQSKLYPLFTDQQVSISFIDEIVLALEIILKKRRYGVFHASSVDLTTPHHLIHKLVTELGKDASIIRKTTLTSFLKEVNNPVRYPRYGGLLVDNTQKNLNIKFSSIDQIIKKLIKQGLH
jgi:dTDP-4-dehydrorhamnose reductase